MEKELEKFALSFDGELFTDSLYQSIYATDASVYRKLPLAVAYPRSENGIKQLIRFAKECNTSLIPRTAGTSLAGQCVGNGIVVDVSKHFTDIISIDTKAKTVKVQPGVIRDELNQYLEPFGLFFGPNTSTSNRCMIGGMVGNNSSGTTSITYGVTRDKVLHLKAILSNEEEVTFKPLSRSEFIAKTKLESLEGTIYKTIYEELTSELVQNEIRKEFPKPEIHRRNTGYAIDALLETEVFGDNHEPVNLCSILCGSEGTLAFISEITLQLDELPPKYSAMVVSHYQSIENCLLDVTVAMQQKLHTCEMIDDVILSCTKENKMYKSYGYFVQGVPKALLLLELRSDSIEELNDHINELINSLDASKLSYAHPVLRDEAIQKVMDLRKAGLGLLGNMVGDRKTVACIEDTAVTLEDLPSFIGEFSELMRSFNQKAVYYAHAGAGELHLRPILNLKDEKDVIFFRKITTAVAELTKKYKGSFSGEHGDGIVRSEFLPMLVGQKNYEVLRKIKYAFDPSNILNPGKIIDPEKMDKSLRYDSLHKERVIDTFLNFDDSEGILRLAEKCNGSGDCRKSALSNGVMCPSYHASKDEKNTTRARANVLREVLTNNEDLNAFNSGDLKNVLDLCLSCKACATECPSNVDIASAKAEFLYQYQKKNGASRTNTLFAKSSIYTRIASKYPRLVNTLFTNSITSNLIKNWAGIAKERSLQNISIKSFSKALQNLNYQDNKLNHEVVLFVDEFSNYLDSEIAFDTYFLLTRLGYDVLVIDHLDSARALLSKGFLEEAKLEVNTNISFLKDLISSEVPLVGIEPSAILGFKDEYIRLASDTPSAKMIAANTFLIEEFLAGEIKKGKIRPDHFTKDKKVIKIHAHCHQKALGSPKATFDVLNLPQNYSVTIISSGCCGMAGSFGLEKEHYDISMKIGELRLFPAIRDTNDSVIIAANGTSCRHQIKDGTNRRSYHPVTILKEALRVNPQ